MNSWLDRGTFCILWVGFMWIADALLSNTGTTSYAALMVGACVMTLIGLVQQVFQNKKS